MADPRAEPHWRSAVDLPLIVLATATVLSLIRSIDQPSFSSRSPAARSHSCSRTRRSRCSPRFCLHGCSVAAACLDRRARSRSLQRRSPPGSSSRPRRTAPTQSSPPPSCSSTACSRSASSSSCAGGCSCGCSSACWSPSPSSPSAYGAARLLRRALRRVALPGAASAVVPRRARSRSAVDDDARGRAGRAVHARHRLGRLPLVAGIAGAVGVVLGAARRRAARPLPRGRRDRRGRARARGGDEARSRVDAGRDGRDHDRRARPSAPATSARSSARSGSASSGRTPSATPRAGTSG